MIALRRNTVSQLPSQVAVYPYAREAVRAGIAHFSIGNFHRAHQAWYLDRLLAIPGNEGWGICGIGLIDDRTERLKTVTFPAQHDLYTLTICPADAPAAVQVIGSIVEYLFAPRGAEAVLARLVDPAIRIVSMTVTEGGYNIDEATGAFRLDTPDVAHDLANPGAPRTVFGFVAEALARRRADGTAPFTVLSCDNLRHNGDVARKAFLAFAEARDPALAAWMAGNVTFPNCMVDRITPAVRRDKAEQLNRASGVIDHLPVFCEDFAQWVVEDKFCDGRPPLEQVGVQFTDDVRAYEAVKLRMLNASHTMLSHPGLLAGYATVDEAIADPRLRTLLEQFLDRDVMPLLTPPAGVVLRDYRDAVLNRFSNPVIGDQLLRIVSDTGSKVPVFLSETLAQVVAQRGDHRRLAFLMAAIRRYLRGHDDKGGSFPVQEPKLTPADLLLAASDDPAAILGLSTFGDWGLQRSEAFKADLRRFDAAIGVQGVMTTLEALLQDA